MSNKLAVACLNITSHRRMLLKATCRSQTEI